MSEDKKKVFDPTEAIKEIAGLRKKLNKTVVDVEAQRIALEDTPAYWDLADARSIMDRADKELAEATAEFKAGCEAVFYETEEKKFPGGQIKETTILEYQDSEAIEWAIKHEHNELLSLVKGKFKKVCGGITPPFVTKTKVGKMYIDADLTSFLEEASDE